MRNLKKNFWGSLAFLCLSLAVFTACGSDDEESGPNPNPDEGKLEVKDERITLQKLDIAKAKCLSMVESGGSRGGSVDETVSSLFKVDENGKVSVVVMTYTAEDEETGKTETRHDLQLKPSSMATIEGLYTVMQNCDLLNEDGTTFGRDITHFYEENSSQLNLLVRNSDGKIFYVPYETFYTYFWNFCIQSEDAISATDNQENVYVAGKDGVIGKITTEGNQLVMKQVSPNNIHAADRNNELWPMSNGTLIVAPTTQFLGEYTLYYPNGSFEDVKAGHLTDSNGDSYTTSYFPVNNGQQLVGFEVRKESAGSDIRTITMNKYSIGTAYGSLQRGEELLKESGLPIWAAPSSLIETNKYYVCGRDFLIDKSTYNIQMLTQEQSEHFPKWAITKDMIYKNRLWSVDNNGSRWIDLNTLEYGEVQFNDIAGRIRVTSSYSNITSGTHYIYGVDYTDGGNVICVTDIETGKCIITHTPDNRTVTALVPLN